MRLKREYPDWAAPKIRERLRRRFRDLLRYPGDLHNSRHELLADVIAVLGNLGFSIAANQPRSRQRQWRSNVWQDITLSDGSVPFQAKAFQNGNVHFRFKVEAIRALNVEAGRLLGWLHGPADVERELGYPAEEARIFFRSNRQLTAANVRRLTGASDEKGVW